MQNILTVPHSDEVLRLGFYGIGTYYGLEIEFEFDNITVFDFVNLWNSNSYELEKYFVLTYDVSLENGIEIVSTPMTFYYHSIILPKLYQWIREINYPLRITEKTGLHIHIDKKNVSSYNLKWLINYLQNNEKEIDLLAGRKENQFCLRMFEDEKYLYSKSSAMRITNNTIELRIFKTFSDSENIIQILGILERILGSS